MGINWKKAAGKIGGGSVGAAAGGMAGLPGMVAGAAGGMRAGGVIGEKGMGGFRQTLDSLAKGNVYGDTKGSKAGPPSPPDDWWKEGRPDQRFEWTNPDGTIKDNFKMTEQRISAPASRLANIDERLNQVQGTSFPATVGGIGAAAGLAGLSARALSNDLSNPAQARMGLIDQQRRQSMDAMNANAAGATAGAMSSLAASGGMDSGARQRLGTDAIKARMAGAAGVYNQANQAKSQVGIQDLTNQYDLQTRLPGMFLDYGRNEMDAQKFNASLGMDKINAYRDQARGEDDRTLLADRFNAANNMDAQRFNIQNQMADKVATDQFSMDRWKTQNAARAGQYASDSQNYYAQQQSNKGLLGDKGGLWGTGLKIF
jgi:hypothetical protein